MDTSNIVATTGIVYPDIFVQTIFFMARTMHRYANFITELKNVLVIDLMVI